jgi:molybdopterin converting factor small subunit
MPTVRLPSLLHPLTGGASVVEASGATLRAVIDDLDRRYPGLAERIVAEGQVRDDIMLALDGDEVRDLDARVPDGAEVHVLPAIAGG